MQTKLYRTDNRTGKKNLVASFKLGIEKYSVCGNYVFVEANVPYKGADVTEKLAVYCYKADGSSKVKLASWFPAEKNKRSTATAVLLLFWGFIYPDLFYLHSAASLHELSEEVRTV